MFDTDSQDREDEDAGHDVDNVGKNHGDDASSNVDDVVQKSDDADTIRDNAGSNVDGADTIRDDAGTIRDNTDSNVDDVVEKSDDAGPHFTVDMFREVAVIRGLTTT